jgi:hypothetical protein
MIPLYQDSSRAGEETRSEAAAHIAAALRYLACEAMACGLDSLAARITAVERTARTTAHEEHLGRD